MGAPNDEVVVTSFSQNTSQPEYLVDIDEHENEKIAYENKISEIEDENAVFNNKPKTVGSTEKISESNSLSNSVNAEKFVDGESEVVEGNSVLRAIVTPVLILKDLMAKYKKVIYITFAIVLSLGITAYMIAACIKNFNRAIPLLVIWSLVVSYNIYVLIRNKFGKELEKLFYPFYKAFCKNMYWIKWVFVACIIAGIGVWIGLETVKRPNQLISGAGYLVFIFLLFISSKYPDKVKWRPVLWGLLIQFCMGLFILRTQAGFDAFNWVGEFAQTFINFVRAGVIFVYGENYAEHGFAFEVLSIVIYFGSFISVMYYLGAMQWLILKIAWLMQISLRTSATESMVAAGNIFVGQTESPLLIRPYIDDLTTSELHAVMTAGFGTIAGSVLGAYLGFGIQAVYVITACVMAAPCALALSKLVYPETKKSKFTSYEGLILEKTDQRNIIEAACVGASQAIPLVLNISANLIAFLSLLAAVNGFLGWFGGLLDFPQLTFELMCSYVFLPITFLMGIEWTYCFKAAELIGVKIFLNEFVAYESLAEMLKMRDNGTAPLYDPNTGNLNWVDERTEAIVTYALCGFANFSSIGIMLGGLGSLAPQRRSEMSKIVVRALVAGIFVSILNACVAGFLYEPRPILCDNMLSTTNWTFTEPDRLFDCCTRAIISLSSDDTVINGTVVCNCCQYPWNRTDFTLDCTDFSCS